MIKRAIDVVLSLIGLLLTWPIMLVCAAAVVLDSRGNPILAQTRVGRFERPFTLYKLRTMRSGTPNVASHDARRADITRVGGILRRTKLDELPQLWNVLKGEMSFVGPRPCLPSQTALIAARRARRVYELRPGITGIAQVQGVDMSEPERLAEVDATYLGRESLAFDLSLVVRTFTGRRDSDAIRSS